MSARPTPRWGGPAGNELLTSAAAVVLTVLLVAEGITIVRMGGLVTVHMFVGMVLIPPVLLTLASTGLRAKRSACTSSGTHHPPSCARCARPECPERASAPSWSPPRWAPASRLPCLS